MTCRATTLYIPHGGGPLPLLDEEGHRDLNQFLREFHTTIDKPDAIVIISAHWEEPVVSITANANPPMLFDYYGFPSQSYEYQYPASGHPALAARIQQLLETAGIESRLDQQRGFDHGVFVPLLLMYPDADIPCLQISLSSSLSAAFHIALGQALSELKQDNLLILGSGFSFHNLSVMTSKDADGIDEKNQAFEDWLTKTCCDKNLTEGEREQGLRDWQNAPHARYCHPREEHLLPLQVCYGLAGNAATQVFQGSVSGFVTSAYRWQQ